MMLLTTLLVLLVLGVFFYFILRSGWGAEMTHGAHVVRGSESQGTADAPTGTGAFVDPVCGMRVAADEGWGLTHAGATYRFCSKSCRSRFEADPERFISKAS